MIKIQKCAAQGDVLFIRVATLPEGATETKEGREHVIAHSETGHDHVARAEQIRLYGVADPMICYLSSETEMEVIHQRPFDTHAPIILGAGIWQVRRQREATLEGWKRVED